MSYNKPHLTYPQQLALMKTRGVTCTDDAHAVRVLESNGYYNTTGYLYPFRLPDPSGAGRLDQVRSGTQFEDIARLIDFDRQLRSTLLKGIQLVEVGVRARIAHVLGARDPFGHLNTAHLDPTAANRSQHRHGRTDTAFNWWLDEYNRLQDRARTEPYVAHNLAKYGKPLPIWIACEFFDFGAVANLYQLLLHADRQAIAQISGLPQERTLRRWLTTLNYVRNICAHNARLWNRVLIQKIQLQPRDLPPQLQHLGQMSNDKAYPVIAATVWLTNHLSPDANWTTEMANLLMSFPAIPGRSITELGAPTRWAGQSPWK